MAHQRSKAEPTVAAAAADAAACTLAHVVETIGSTVLHVLAAPRGLDLPIRGVVFHDPVDHLPDGPDQLLLLTGVRTDDPRALDLAREAAGKGYSALVVKRRGHDITSLVTAASERSVAVVTVADDVAWRQLDALVLSVLGSGGVEAGGAGDDLFAVANAVAAVVGGSVAIEDLERHVLAYSSVPGQRIDALREQGILQRRVPDLTRNLAQYQRLLAAAGVVRFDASPGDGEMARLAIAVRAGARPLGTLWAIEGEAGSSPEVERALIEGAKLAAMGLIRALEEPQREQQLRETTLRSALDGSTTPTDAAFRLTVTTGAEPVLLGFAPGGAEGQAVLLAHLGSAIARHAAVYRPDSFVATTSHCVYVFLPTGGERAGRRFAGGALTTLSATLPGAVTVGIAPVPTDPLGLPAARAEVDDILRAISGAESHIASLDDARTDVLLDKIRGLVKREPRLLDPAVHDLVIHDQERRTEFGASVLAWLQAAGDVRAAAASLAIHPNTVRYRVRRAEELFGIRIRTGEDRLATWIQLLVAGG